jgi:hypothetical protein
MEAMVHDQYAFASVSDGLNAWNRRDWAAFASLHTHNVVYDSPHSHVVGRRAVVQRYRELVDLVPDLCFSALRLVENNRSRRRAMFEYVQTGTLAGQRSPVNEPRGLSSRFVIHTTMFVQFDDDGRMCALRTVHR